MALTQPPSSPADPALPPADPAASYIATLHGAPATYAHAVWEAINDPSNAVFPDPHSFGVPATRAIHIIRRITGIYAAWCAQNQVTPTVPDYMGPEPRPVAPAHGQGARRGSGPDAPDHEPAARQGARSRMASRPAPVHLRKETYLRPLLMDPPLPPERRRTHRKKGH